ncbi:MAG: OmpA family protein [Burkholderiaceae bacterium]|nr:OmpA family protein [Burkholderiaceae bacterium]
MPTFFYRTTALCTSLIAVGLLAACASREPLPALEEARTAISTVASDPAVNQYAQLELKQATDALAKADRQWADEHDAAEGNHLAYLARQRAEIATNTARSRQLEATLKQASGEADRIRLQARTTEADEARSRADAEARNAQLARQQAMSSEQRAAQEQANAAAAQNRVRALEQEMRELEAQQTERGLIVTLGDVLFAFDKAELSMQAAPRLDKLANFLKQFPERRLLIEGYTDNVGSASYNLQLSERRAMAVRDALVQRGVETSRISARGYGKEYSVADNAQPTGRAMNRRVEIVIADDKGTLRAR